MNLSVWPEASLISPAEPLQGCHSSRPTKKHAGSRPARVNTSKLRVHGKGPGCAGAASYSAGCTTQLLRVGGRAIVPVKEHFDFLIWNCPSGLF